MRAPAPPFRFLPRLLTSFLEVLAPEACVVCGQRRGEALWATGLSGDAPGLRSWHATHCCRACLDRWKRTPLSGRCGGLALWSAQLESASLVSVIGAWKYRRMCGLVRPLAELLAPVLQAAAAYGGPATLVPIPLHDRRRRERGFDQTLQLSTLAASAVAMPVAQDILVRVRPTRQQASETTCGAARSANVARAFIARCPRSGEALELALLDDLLTTGATAAAAALALQEAGWHVAWCASLGMAKRLERDDVDTEPVEIASS